MLTGAGWIHALRPYRSLLWASAALALITSIYPRPGNALGQSLFSHTDSSARLPTELFGIAWWLIGAWLLNGLLDQILRRTLFPRDNQPHARRLFADLASVLFYVIAFVGIMETVMKEPVSAVLATSGVLAIVAGLALQNTLSDVFSGLAINLDRPFGAGDWITLASGVEGQVLEINWRSTRLRTWQNDIVILPNSVVAKSPVTNHTSRFRSHTGTFALDIDSAFAPADVIAVLVAAANGVERGVTVEAASAYAAQFNASTVTYQVVFPLSDFGERAEIQSELMQRIGAALIQCSMPIGQLAIGVRILREPHPQTTGSAVKAQRTSTTR